MTDEKDRPAEPADEKDTRRLAPNDTDPTGGVDMPPDTGPNPPPLPGSSEAAEPVQGIYRPDVGPGGADIDTGDRPLAGRGRNARGPQTDDEPDGQ